MTMRCAARLAAALALGLAAPQLAAGAEAAAGAAESRETLQMVNALLADRVAPAVNQQLATRVKGTNLDPLPELLNRPIIQVRDMTGLSTLRFDSLKATSVVGQPSGDYTAELVVQATVGEDLLAKGAVGKAPHSLPIDVKVTKVLLKDCHVTAHVDGKTYAITSLKVRDLKLDYDTMRVTSSHAEFGEMLDTVVPSYKSDIAEWFASRAVQPLSEHLNAFLPLSMVDVPGAGVAQHDKQNEVIIP